ncbi:ferredoxin [Rhodococcus sp. MEB032]|uniref:ferredoxin n=1 Tax=Rhodococcus sp. MEB032 TaxID=3040322 RepID=UPI0025509F12|nr:ferredoxin [Rhodococcus sp. MEB032]
MKLRVDRNLCIATGMCAGFSPDALDLDAMGQLVLLTENPPASMRADLQQAVSACPVQALSLTEE